MDQLVSPRSPIVWEISLSPLGWGPKHQNIFRYLATNTNTNRLSPVLVATIELNQDEYLLNNVVSSCNITQL